MLRSAYELNRCPTGANNGLIKASNDVVKICVFAETIIKSESNFSASNIILKIVSAGIRSLNVNLRLSNHSQDQDPLNEHIIQLILKNYFTIRLHRIIRTKN